jgi:GMP synthase (glutamine-hydrolysing)
MYALIDIEPDARGQRLRHGRRNPRRNPSGSLPSLRQASPPACDHQAFANEPNLLGLQFHVEVDPARIESWLIGHTVELARERISSRSIRDDTERYGRHMVELRSRALNEWLDGLRL